MKLTNRFLTIFISAGLAACGGGGDSTTTSSTDRLKSPSVGIALNESNCFYQYTFQNFLSVAGSDPLLAQQWHLQNTGQPILGATATAGEDLRVIQAWNQTKGEGIRVAVVDDAIEIIHEDLAPNAVTGGSYNYRSSAPFALYPLPCYKYKAANDVLVDDNHGTAVTGIIVARDNNGVGGAGIAPRAQLVAYNALATETDADIADALTRDLANNAVVHNSWGSTDDGKLHTADAPFIAAIKKGIETGRNGKGTIYVFPAGNGGCYITTGNPAACAYDDNANLDGYTNKLGQVTVGAIGPDGKRLTYSEPGSNILVSAPAEDITTTTVKGGWRSDFRGTSASAPMISGVVALMLSANPELTWRDVKLILAKSARKNHATDTGWISFNGYNFNPFYGFGVPDANKAVTLSKSWNSVGGSSSLKSCGPYGKTVNATLLDEPSPNREVTDSVTVDASCAISQIEFVEIIFTAQHGYSGDLRITLESPNGLQSVLAQRRSCVDTGDACRPYNNWQFGSVRHLDESALGQWKLKVSDDAPTDTGTWKNWSLKFYGR
jgi:proprotein convertase subtilisin/kexin type 2